MHKNGVRIFILWLFDCLDTRSEFSWRGDDFRSVEIVESDSQREPLHNCIHTPAAADWVSLNMNDAFMHTHQNYTSTHAIKVRTHHCVAGCQSEDWDVVWAQLVNDCIKHHSTVTLAHVIYMCSNMRDLHVLCSDHAQDCCTHQYTAACTKEKDHVVWATQSLQVQNHTWRWQYWMHISTLKCLMTY